MTTQNITNGSLQEDENTAAHDSMVETSTDAKAEGSQPTANDHRIRSFVIHAGRMTTGQQRAMEELGPKYLIDVSDLQPKNFNEFFGREAPLVVEIGFGMGKSFIEMAAHDPLRNYLGIEVHPPGVGAAMKTAEEAGVKNVRIIRHDAFDVLKFSLRPESVDILQIFFPDPWHKARHHKRRLVNPEFLEMVTPLLKHNGEIRMATDWQDYAEQMLECLTNAKELVNTAPDGGYIPRPEWRPLTKFEQRGERLGHGIWDLVFKRV